MIRSHLVTVFICLLLAGLYGQDADSLMGAKLYQDARTLYSEDREDEAVETFLKALDNFTEKNTDAYGTTLYQIGYVYDKSNRDKTAVEYYERAMKYADRLIEETNDYSLARGTLLQLGFAYLYIDEREKVSRTMNRLLKLTAVDTTWTYQYQTYSHNLLGSNYQYLGKWDSAAYHAKEALRTSSFLTMEDIQIKGESFNINAELNYNLGNYKEAQFYLNKQLELYRGELGDFHPYLARPIMQLGITAFGSSNYKDAADYFKQALDLSKLNGDSTSYNYINLAVNASSLYEILGEDRLAIDYLMKAIEIYESVESGEANTYENYAIMAHLQTKINAFEKALEYAEKATPLFEMDNGRNNLKQKAARKLAKAYSAMEAYEKAEHYAFSSLGWVKDLNITGTELPYAYLTIAQVYLEQRMTEQAKPYIDSAEFANKTDGNYKNKDVAVETSRLMLEAISQSIDTYSSEEIVSELISRDDLIAGFKTNIDSELGESFESHSFYDAAVALAFDAYVVHKDNRLLDLFVSLSDRNRSNALKDLIGKAEFYESIALGNGILEQKKQLISDLAIIKKQQNITQDPTEVASLNLAYQQKKTDFDELKELIENEYPVYHQYNYAEASLDVDHLQNKLAESEETLISYYLNDDWLYIAVGRDQFVIEKIEWLSLFDFLINDFRKKLLDPNSSLIHGPEKLYELLIEPIEAHIQTQKIRIINDGVLSYIPFEVLTNAEGQYLFEKYDISYAYSAGTYLLNTDQSPGQNMLAYAPLFESDGQGDEVRNSIGYLPGTKLELDAIDNQIRGEFISGTAATESDFKERANGFEILHLATHAIVDDRSPDFSKLLFNTAIDTINDGDLHAYEIMGLNLKAKLVTLSACNTGFGKIKKGEGVMSLSRAFAYAGAPATVVSLWPASDRSTPELMNYFYRNLKNGQSKDEALNNARKQYLARAEGKARHPFYWGSFVVIGDNSPIDGGANMFFWIVPGVILLVLILVFYRRKKN